jgi:signal transduction histidine kinase
METHEDTSVRRPLAALELTRMTSEDGRAAGLSAMSQLATLLARELATPVRSLEDEVAFLERGSSTLCRFMDFALEAEPQAATRARLDALRSNIPAVIAALRSDCERLGELLAELQTLSDAIPPPYQR